MTGAPTMRQRFAAQSVIEELLHQQSSVPPRSSLARFFGGTPLGGDCVAWYLGAKGEIAVGRLLSKLPPAWTVFHALPVGTKGSDIDHLVVGPGGILTINTKHHRGKNIWVADRTMMVAGQKMPYIRNAEFEAERVTRLVGERMPQSGPVRAVIALVDPKQITIREKPRVVTVIDARHLRRWLTHLPTLLDEGEVTELASILDSPAAWGAAPSAAPNDVLTRFEALDAEVRSARIRRLFWMLLAAAAIIGGSIPVLQLAASALLPGAR